MPVTTKPTFWQRSGVQSWFLKKETGFTETASMTPDLVYKYIIEKFRESIAELSFADRIIFYHEYIICFSPPDYNKFMDNNRGTPFAHHKRICKSILYYFKRTQAKR